LRNLRKIKILVNNRDNNYPKYIMPSKSKSQRARKGNKKVSFEKRVLSVVHRQAETKQKVISIYNNTSITGSGFPSGGLQVINLPSLLGIVQGVEQEQRNGNEINNCKVRVRGLIESLNYNQTTNNNLFNYEVHMVVFKKKDDPNNNAQALKQLPNNTTGPCDGSLMNTMYPYNKDGYIIKKVKVFRMSPFLFSVPDSPQLAQPNTYLFKRFVMDIPISKKWKYTDGLGAPSNEWTSIGIYVVNSDGTINTGQTARAQITMDATIRYDDF
jgi:hypothetical protein